MKAAGALSLLLCAAAAASAPLGPRTMRPALDCAAVEGAEPLLAAAAGRVIVIDAGEASAGSVAAAALLCLSAAEGGKVLWAAADDTGLAAHAARYSAAGAHLAAAPLAAMGDGADHEANIANAQSEGARRAAAMARAVSAARAAHDEARTIVVARAPEGARDPIGLSGYTWRPLGALLPATETIALRAEASLRPGLRVRFAPFSDVPERGAAMRYDGLIEVGPDLLTHAEE